MILVLLLISSAVVIPFISVFAQQKPVPEAQEIIIRVDGASCPFCAFGLEKRLGQLAGVASVRLEMKDGEVFVTLKKGARVSERALRQAVEEAGFTPREIIFPPEP
jgi:mercuric ion binding protein